MKKVVCLVLIATLLICSVCANGTKEATGSSPIATQKKESKEVTVYSSMDTEWSNPLIKEFEEQTGIKVNVVTAGTGELLARIEAESSNTLCDVLWAGDSGNSQSFQDKYAESYQSTEDKYYDAQYKDAENHKWYAQHIECNIAIYNKDLVKEEEAPKSWADLCDSKWKGKLYIPDPVKSGTGLNHVIALMLSMGKDDASRYEWLKKFATNLDGITASGSSIAYKAVVDGEYPIGFTYEEAAFRYLKAGAHIGLIYMNEGVNIARTSIQLLKNSPNQENGKKFIDFMLGKEVQSKFGTVIMRRSARNDLPVVEGMPALSTIKSCGVVDPVWKNDNKQKIIETFKDALIK